MKTYNYPMTICTEVQLHKFLCVSGPNTGADPSTARSAERIADVFR